MGVNAAAEYTHAETLLTRGKVTAVPLAPGASTTIDLLCGGDATLVVEAELTGAANGDLVISLRPFRSDGTLLASAPITAVRASGPTFSGGLVQYYGEFDVSSLDKVRITLQNQNVGAQTLNWASWRLS